MPSLRQLIDTHGSLLLLDAASATVQVGWISPPPSATGGAVVMRWQTSDHEAGVGVFQCLEALQLRPSSAGAFVFCDGPGSVLGIRTTAMALRTWNAVAARPVFAFHSLSVVAHALGRADVHVIADARRDSWHCLSLGCPLRRVPTAELHRLGGELAMPAGFRHWTPLPQEVRLVPYSLVETLPRLLDADVFRASAAPDAFLHEEPSYATWTPQIHRAS